MKTHSGAKKKVSPYRREQNQKKEAICSPFTCEQIGKKKASIGENRLCFSFFFHRSAKDVRGQLVFDYF